VVADGLCAVHLGHRKRRETLRKQRELYRRAVEQRRQQRSM